MSRIQKNDKWGVIDKTGKIIIPCLYDHITAFSKGLARIRNNGKWGVIDNRGKIIVPCIYDSAHFSKGLVRIYDENDNFLYDVNQKGERVER